MLTDNGPPTPYTGNTIQTKTNHDKKKDELSNIVDSEWLKSTFIISDKDIVLGSEYSRFIRKNRYYSTADSKFTGTSPGMNVAVNPKPQFTRYCDIRRPGKLKSRQTSDVTLGTTSGHYGLGMGRYYSEAIDDNQQRIFLRFGVPKYMSMLLWLGKSFDIDRAVLQNRGTITSTLLEAVNVISKFFAFAAAPLLAVGMWVAGAVVKNSRFYSVKPTMYIYWSTVEDTLNSMVARRSMLPNVLPDFTYRTDNTMGREKTVSTSDIQALADMAPDIVDATTGRISVFAIALRAQAAYNRMLREDYERSQSVNVSTDFTGYPASDAGDHNTYFTNRRGESGLFTKYLFKIAYDFLISGNPDEEVKMKDEKGSATAPILTSLDTMSTDPSGTPLTLDLDNDDPQSSVDAKLEANAKAKKSTYDRYKEYMMAELSEGAAFAVFNVESTGSVGESFSNSSGANPIESTFNSLSAKSRNIGNVISSATDIPIISDTLKLAADAGATILSNASFGIANPLLALLYGVNITMPKQWESSSVSLPTGNYKIKLISPYGNAYSQLFNIYLPLSMIMAGSLPRSTGSSTYTSPFVCELFDRGRVNSSLAMISNVNITRGTSNLAFSRNGHPNAIDVDMTVSSLDEVMSMDVSSNGVLSRAMSQLSPDFSDTPLISYINTITGVDVYTQVYRVPMMRLKIAERIMNLKAIVNPDPAAAAAFTVDKVPLGSWIRDVLGNNQATLNGLMQQ